MIDRALRPPSSPSTSSQRTWKWRGDKVCVQKYSIEYTISRRSHCTIHNDPNTQNVCAVNRGPGDLATWKIGFSHIQGEHRVLLLFWKVFSDLFPSTWWRPRRWWCKCRHLQPPWFCSSCRRRTRCRWPASSSCPCHRRCTGTSSAERSPSSWRSSSGKHHTCCPKRKLTVQLTTPFVPIPGAVLSSDSNLLGALRHLRGFFWKFRNDL